MPPEMIQQLHSSSLKTAFTTGTAGGTRTSRQCNVCGLIAQSSFHLTEHMMIHTGIKKYQCHFCNYSCIKSCNLKAHLRTHTGERPYLCPHCPYSSAESGNLKKHIKYKHAQDNLS